MKAEFLDVDGRRTRYFEAGAGPTLLLVHGIGMTADTWLRNIDELARVHRVLAPDLLGCGFTDGMTREGAPPLDDMLVQLRAFAEATQVERCSLVGSSLGGWLSVLWYLSEPERFRSLVLVCCETVLAGSAAEIRSMAAGSVENGRRAFADASVEGTRARIERLVADPADVPESIVLLQHLAAAFPHAKEAFERRTSGLMELLDDSPLLVRDRLSEIAVPVMTISGDADPRGRAAYRERVAEALQGTPGDHISLVLEQTGHLAQMERPNEFNAAVENFLRECEARSEALPSSGA